MWRVKKEKKKHTQRLIKKQEVAGLMNSNEKNNEENQNNTLKQTGVSKRITLLLFLTLVVGGVYGINKLGYVTVPDVLFRMIDIFLVSILTILAITIILRTTLHRIFNYLETEVEIEERIFLAKVYTIFLYVMGIAIILWKVGVSLTSLTLFLGLVTSAIAFGIRDVILSAVAWLIIINKKPFRIGDVIRVGDDIGQVTRIGTFFSTLEPLRGAGQFIKIPNRILLEKNMINMGQKRVVHKAKIMLAKVPKQSGQRMKKILAVIKKYTQDIEEKDRAIAVIESDQNGWYVWLSFPLPLGEEEKRSLILAEAYEILKDCVKK